MNVDALLEEFVLNFHFLRPEWFYALIPGLLLFMLLRYRQSHHSNWEKAIEPHLLSHILDNPDQVVSKSPLTFLFIAWLLATVALAGPVFSESGWNARCEPPWDLSHLEVKIKNSYAFGQNRPGCKAVG